MSSHFPKAFTCTYATILRRVTSSALAPLLADALSSPNVEMHVALLFDLAAAALHAHADTRPRAVEFAGELLYQVRTLALTVIHLVRTLRLFCDNALTLYNTPLHCMPTVATAICRPELRTCRPPAPVLRRGGGGGCFGARPPILHRRLPPHRAGAGRAWHAHREHAGVVRFHAFV